MCCTMIKQTLFSPNINKTWDLTQLDSSWLTCLFPPSYQIKSQRKTQDVGRFSIVLHILHIITNTQLLTFHMHQLMISVCLTALILSVTDINDLRFLLIPLSDCIWFMAWVIINSSIKPSYHYQPSGRCEDINTVDIRCLCSNGIGELTRMYLLFLNSNWYIDYIVDCVSYFVMCDATSISPSHIHFFPVSDGISLYINICSVPVSDN